MSEEKIKVSVIIPVYNTEKYLRECINSITGQSLKEIEIICIDDGSTDSSFKILEEYSKSDKRIKVLKQNHKFAGAARNYGMKEAKGDYIFFIDSDDFISEKTLEGLYTKAVQNGCEIALMTSITTFDETKPPLINRKNKAADKIVTYKDIKKLLFMNYCTVFCNRLYKRDFLNKYGLNFSKLRNGEDLELSFPSIILANKIVLTDEFSYFYRIHGESTNHNKSLFDNFTAYKNTLDVLKKHNIYYEVEQEFKNRLCHDIMNHLNYMKTFSSRYRVFKYIKGDDFKIFDLENLPEETFCDRRTYERYRDVIKYSFIQFYVIQFLKKVKRIFLHLYYARTL